MKHNLLQLKTSSCTLEIHPNSKLAYNYWKGFSQQTPFYNFDATFLENKLSDVIFNVTAAEDSAPGTSRYYVISNFSAFQMFKYLERSKALPRQIIIRQGTRKHRNIKQLADEELAGLFMNAVTHINASQAFKILLKLPPNLQAAILKPMHVPENAKALRHVFAKRFSVTHEDLVFSKRLSDPTDSDVLRRLNEW